MKSLRLGGAFVAVIGMLGTGAWAQSGSLTGFRADSSVAELESEKAFDAALDPADLSSWLERMSSAPNQVGSPHDKDNADFTLAKFKEWGWDAHIETFYVLYPTPKSMTLELVGPTSFKAKLFEPQVAGDRTSGATGGLPPYNIYGADGDVTADLVYANFGMPADYVDLQRRGIDVKGRIVITRYGVGWRGLKAKLAQEHGAVGCIIYSDPHEDGYFTGDSYPKGASRPEDGVQRGSVADITMYSGDPLTPGVGATQDAVRLKIEDAKTIMRIPVIPISYADAKPLLAALEGPVAPPGWRGALPLTYHIGPGPAKVHLAITSDWSQKPIYDVIAVMGGSTYPNQWVIRGNHHDAWVFGAWDPLSGNTAVMAEAKAIGSLAKSGWRPKRTLVYASWDGEEAGLLGSTEWMEAHAAELQRKAVLYVNSDTNARGILKFGGSFQFQHMANEVASTVGDPETGASVLDRLRASLKVAGLERPPTETEAVGRYRAAVIGEDIPLGALGSGSDYTPFLQHLGIASLDLEYVGEGADAGIYHSTYDSFDHFIRFGDPKFSYGIALAETAGHIVLRTADADVIPVRFGPLAAAIAVYASDVQLLAETEREASRSLNKLLGEGAYRLASDPLDPVAAPQAEDEVPRINFAPLNAASARLTASARAYDAALDLSSAGDFRLPASEVLELNALLQGAEQSLLSKQGLPGREWYQHMIYAPGVYTGYGAKTIPGVREAIELRHWDVANAYVQVVAETLGVAAAHIDEATKDLAARLGAGSARRVSNGPTPTPPPDS
jgi:N-acetylated-alpha-linked acidic dipeptidase